MKWLSFIVLIASMQVWAGENMDKAKRTINETADKIDSGTRKVINTSKEKWKQRQVEREAKKAKEAKKDN
jgi:hypothetical protein